MPDKKKAARLAREGFDLWQAGRLQEAVQSYREALACADPDHFGTPDYHGEFGAVLAALDRNEESREEYERSLTDTIRQPGTEDSIVVVMARWFLGQQLLKMHRPKEALATVEPSLKLDSQSGIIPKLGPLRIVQARALWQLGRAAEARESARVALAAAASDDDRARIREELTGLLQDSDVG